MILLGVFMLDKLSLSLILILITLLAISAFFSSAETAFSSANKIRLKNYASKNQIGAKRAYYILQNFDHALSSILIGNNLVNVLAATIAGQVAASLFGQSKGVAISTIVMTILLLIFGEVLPKSLAKENAEKISLKISSILLIIMKLLLPFTWVLVKLKQFISARFTKTETMPSITEEELKQMVNISEEEGIIDMTEKQLVQNSLDFDEILVSEILTPRTNIVAIDVNLSIEEITTILLDQRYSRIPVYEENIDNIIGILSERDFYSSLIKESDFHIRDLIRKPILVMESTPISNVLAKLQKNRVQMAIVLDEFGGTAGLITLEDILEELVGEIWDEHDEKVQGIKQIDANIFELSGEFPLDEFARLLKIELPDSAYHTVGGWIFEIFQEIPAIGEVFTYEHLKIVISETTDRRIKKMKVYINDGL